MKHFASLAASYYETLRPAAVGLVCQLYNNLSTEDALDIYSEAWEAVGRNLHLGRTPALDAPAREWKNYVCSICRNRASKFSEQKLRNLYIDAEADGTQVLNKIMERDSETATCPDNDEVIDRLVRDELDRLNPRHRQLLIDFYQNGLSTEEIARELGYTTARSVITTKKRILEQMQQNVKTRVDKMDSTRHTFRRSRRA